MRMIDPDCPLVRTMFDWDDDDPLPELNAADGKLVADALNAELDALKAEIRSTRAALAAEQEQSTT